MHYDLYTTTKFAAAVNKRAALQHTYYARFARGAADLASLDSRFRALKVYGTYDLDAAAGQVPRDQHRAEAPEEEDRDAEDPAEIGELPVIRRRARNAEQLRHRQVEHAEGVGLPDRQMDRQRRRRPSANARRPATNSTVQTASDDWVDA